MMVQKFLFKGKIMILNLTQHKATPDQLADGVVDLPEEIRLTLCRLLTVDSLPTEQEIVDRCITIASLIFVIDADNAPSAVMIGGAPWMMGPLVRALRYAGVVQCLASFSKRESVESTDPKTGNVVKTSVFRHAGFIAC